MRQQFDEGYRDHNLKVGLSNNPYDRAKQPGQYKAWREGWKAANFDSKMKG